MKPARRAVIDVGTNSIKLLVADVDGRDVKPVWEESKQTRLGKGFYDSHRLQPEAIAKTAEAVEKFAMLAREHGATAPQVIATSAARDAINGHELTSAIKATSGLVVEIISGEKEADWVFQGVTSDPALSEGPLLLLDVGGGSSEFIVGRGKNKLFAQSFSLGTVRLLEQFPHSDPPTTQELEACRSGITEVLGDQVQPRVQPILEKAARLDPTLAARIVATGGSATILARMEAELDDFNRDKIESTRLSAERIQWHVKKLWSLRLEERKRIVGLPKNRADVILTGALIYEGVLETFDFEELRVSTRGLRFAAVMRSDHTREKSA